MGQVLVLELISPEIVDNNIYKKVDYKYREFSLVLIMKKLVFNDYFRNFYNIQRNKNFITRPKTRYY